MRKPSAIESRLVELNQLREAPPSPARIKALQKHLADKANLIVAKAARIAADLQESTLVPDLVLAFDRLMVNPVQTDKGCLAKTQIAKSLNVLECEQEAIFLKGIRHVQLEPAFGGPVDTACELRVASAIALVRMGSSEAMIEVVTLMTDKEVEARTGAVRALTYSEREEASLLLRFKVLTGDAEPSVISECFVGLMKLAPGRALSFVAQFVDPSDTSLSEPAALAIGESRLPEAFKVLKEKWEANYHPRFRQMLLLPMALSRQEAAIEFLLSQAASTNVGTAGAAVMALAIYREDPKIRERLLRVIGESGKAELQGLFEREFGAAPPLA